MTSIPIPAAIAGLIEIAPPEMFNANAGRSDTEK
jgi:hypothetical protein